MTNLNELQIPNDDGGGVALRQYDLGLDCSVYFRDVKARLLEHIAAADYVLGCVAWLTDDEVLAALAQKRGVSLVVQKEDFLRPDSAVPAFVNKERLRELYEEIPGVERSLFNTGIASALSRNGDPRVDAVRCMGMCPPKGGASKPNMHHKFAVFCRARGPKNWEGWDLPDSAFTGSYNWTRNATRSLENAVHIRDHKAAKAFYLEFQQVLALSEPLDWSSEWVAPEWRIGT